MYYPAQYNNKWKFTFGIKLLEKKMMLKELLLRIAPKCLPSLHASRADS